MGCNSSTGKQVEPASKAVVPPVPKDFAEEMSRTLHNFKDRASNTELEDENDEETMSSGNRVRHDKSPSSSYKKRLNACSNEFLVDTTVIDKQNGRGDAKVNELTKAKLLTYYAGRGGERRERSFSFTPEASEPAVASDAADLAFNEPVSGREAQLRRSGSYRAARSQRAYSQPPLLLEGRSDSSDSTVLRPAYGTHASRTSARQPRSRSLIDGPEPSPGSVLAAAGVEPLANGRQPQP